MSKPIGLSGLLNLGNSCFLNAIIQCLNYSEEFSNFLNNDEFCLLYTSDAADE